MIGATADATMITKALPGSFRQTRAGMRNQQRILPLARRWQLCTREIVTESLRDIRIFVAAYEERSFTAVAVREHATHRAFSQHIRKLEEGFSVKLFNREKGQVAPTPAADAY
jgi:DNA-binding transcriptional ArsR family regulator